MRTWAALFGAVARLASGFPIKVDQGTKPARFTSDDCNRQRKPKRAGANEGMGSTANSNPDGQRILYRAPDRHLVPSARDGVFQTSVRECDPDICATQIWEKESPVYSLNSLSSIHNTF